MILLKYGDLFMISDDGSQSINNLTYSEIVGLLKERNRPSGGIKTIHEVAANTFLSSASHALEIGVFPVSQHSSVEIAYFQYN
jgi:hypothetical protein